MAKGDQAIIVAIIGIIGVVLSAYLYQTGFFTSADIRFGRQPYSDSLCPSPLNTYSGDFEIYFSNSNGNRATDLFVEIQSPDNISFIKNKDSINIPVGQTSTLKFVINSSSLKINNYDVINNATINIVGKYTINNRGKINSITSDCKYKKDGSSLVLVK